MDENKYSKEYDISVVISNPVANRVQFVEMLENQALRSIRREEFIIIL